jgi:hypothetical protein
LLLLLLLLLLMLLMLLSTPCQEPRVQAYWLGAAC